jgi:tetratricopeptide (TPR) repeat protein
MKDIRRLIELSLEAKLPSEGFDLIDLVPVPSGGDRMVKLRSLAELLDEFDRDSGKEGTSYIVQVSPTKKTETTQRTVKSDVEGMYFNDGNLNISVLEQNAEVLMAAGDFLLARNIYQAILKTGKSSAASLFKIGLTFEAEKNLLKAISIYEESLAYEPTFKAYERLASLLRKTGQDQYAAEIIERALAGKNIPPKVQYELHKSCGNCWMRKDYFNRAEIHHRSALKINPDSDEVRSNLGSLYLKQQKLNEAKRCFEDAVAANSKNAKAHSGLGISYLGLNDKKSALTSFKKSLRIDLMNPTAIFYLVKLAYELKDYAEAAEILKNYTNSAPVNPSLLYSLAGLQYHTGSHSEASNNVRKILDMNSKHKGALKLQKHLEE